MLRTSPPPYIYIYNESLQAAHTSELSLHLEGLSHVRPPTPSSLAHLHTPSFPLWAALCFPNHADVRGSDDDAINVVKSKAALNPTLETLTEASEKVMACSASPTVVLTMEAGLAMNRKAAALLHGTASLTKNLFCCALFNFFCLGGGGPLSHADPALLLAATKRTLSTLMRTICLIDHSWLTHIYTRTCARAKAFRGATGDRVGARDTANRRGVLDLQRQAVRRRSIRRKHAKVCILYPKLFVRLV